MFARKVLFVTLMICIGSIAFSQFALSQTTSVPSADPNAIQLTPIIVALINLVFPLVAAIATALVNARVKDKQLADILHNAIDNGLGILKRKATEAAQGAAVDLRPGTPAMDAAVKYVVDNAAEAIKHFNIPNDRIADKIVARLGLAEIATNLATTTSSNETTLAPLALTTTRLAPSV